MASPSNAFTRDVVRLASRHGIIIEWRKAGAGGRANRRKRWIKIPPIKSAVTYALALHELGHILGPRQTSHRLEKEVGAWEWAKANALEWTNAMDGKMQRCLASYYHWAMRRRGVIQPDSSHVLWTLLDRQTVRAKDTLDTEF